jgi:hypothetical protein
MLIYRAVANRLSRTFPAAFKLAVTAVLARLLAVRALAGLAQVNTPIAAGDFQARNRITR